MNKDYYKILNINRNSSQDEVKKAFRSLSKQHHPDKGGDENVFKEMSEAYDTLGDIKKREEYNHKLDNPFHGGNEDGVNMQDIFNKFFNQNRRQNVRKGKNLNIPLRVSLEDVFFGKNKILKYKRKINCVPCGGSGGNTHDCQMCRGSGIKEQVVGNAFFRQVRRETCNVCNGTGRRIIDACNHCNGVGKKNEETKVDFKIPYDLMTGQVYTFRQRGEEIQNGEPGDLHIQVVIERHSHFTLSDKDLIFQPQIDITDLLLGTQIAIPYFGNVLSSTIPPCSKLGVTFTVRGKGMPTQQGPRGNILVKPQIKMPSNLTTQEKRWLEDLRNSENFRK
tara:strand:- start:244 stop:1248 length:1005 start_codon:yes stop_codon:yes gene_type:complete